MIKNKKQMFLVIGVFALVMLLTTVTYAFFNYTRTGVSNTIRVGRISFVTRQTETINLTNVFPISSSEATGENPNYGEVVIEIVGDTDYSGGIEYLVSAVDANIYTTEGQPVPISLDIKIDDDLGTENNNYFTVRENTNTSIYKRIVGNTLVGDQMLLVGYIAPNSVSGTPDGIDATITIKAYLDKDKIKISDTYDGTESDNMGTTNEWAEGKTVITTPEWNALQQSGVSFKVKVEANEGIWVNGSLEEIMKRDNIGIDIEQGVDFSKISSEDGLNDEGTRGVYLFSDTVNDDNPIYYYRGNVKNNNVIFANKCWKVVRTTETGGTKLLYNGVPKTVSIYENNDTLSDTDINYTNDVTYPYAYDSTTKKWTNTNTNNTYTTATFIFTVSESTAYSIDYDLSLQYLSDDFIVYKDDVEMIRDTGIKIKSVELGNLTPENIIKIEYKNNTYGPAGNISFSVVKKYGSVRQINSCDNDGDDSLITVNGSSAFRFINSNSSIAYAGYMYGDEFNASYSNWTSGAYFGSGFTWDGSKYTLVDATVTKPDATHHYSCNKTNANESCSFIRYVYYDSGSRVYYVILSDGIDIEGAIKKMQENRNDSNAKKRIDNWYLNNMNQFTNRLEDTIWCNDRSIIDLGGWDPNGEIASSDSILNFAALGRSNWGYERVEQNHPSLSCSNKSDRFTVNNPDGNMKLTYPVAMLTEDELVLSGSRGGAFDENYLVNGKNYWLMSPDSFNTASTLMFYVSLNGNLHMTNVTDTNGIRPSVSLKPGQLIQSGTGLATDPYVIE